MARAAKKLEIREEGAGNWGKEGEKGEGMGAWAYPGAGCGPERLVGRPAPALGRFPCKVEPSQRRKENFQSAWILAGFDRFVAPDGNRSVFGITNRAMRMITFPVCKEWRPHIGSMHQKPEDLLLKGMGSALPTAPKDIFLTSRPSGVSKSRRAATDRAEQDSTELEAWQEEPQESAGEEKPANPVLLKNLAWSERSGVFNEKIFAKVEAELPPGMENLTRVTLTLFAIGPDGQREQIVAHDANLEKGRAEREFTLYYPQFKIDGELPKSCRYLFSAKHSRSVLQISPELEVAPKPFCLDSLRKILETMEADLGYPATVQFIRSLDYKAVCELAHQGGPGNDANAMPTRFFLLPGADDGLLQTMDSHPEDGAHRMSVANLRKALIVLGYDTPSEGPFDPALESCLLRFLEAQEPVGISNAKAHRVVKGETLGSIAKKHGLPGWTPLYEANKASIGKHPNHIAVGLELKIPALQAVKGERLLRQYNADPEKFRAGTPYAYPWVLFSFNLEDKEGKSISVTGKKRWVLKRPGCNSALASEYLEGAGPFAFLVPAAGEAELEIDSLYLEKFHA